MSPLRTALQAETHHIVLTEIPNDASLDKGVERREQIEAYKSGSKPYSFIRFFEEISSGELSMEEFDILVGLASGYEGVSQQQVCAQVREMLHQEPNRAAQVSAEMKAKISLIADS